MHSSLNFLKRLDERTGMLGFSQPYKFMRLWRNTSPDSMLLQDEDLASNIVQRAKASDRSITHPAPSFN